MTPQDEVALERLLADTNSPAERNAFLERVDRDPALQTALCDALCEDVLLLQWLTMEQAERPRKQYRRLIRSGFYAAAGVILAAATWFALFTDASVVPTAQQLAAAGRHHGRVPAEGEWTYLGRDSLRVTDGADGRDYQMSQGLLQWRSSAGTTRHRSFAGRHLRVTPLGTALSLLDRRWDSLVQVYAGSVAVMDLDGVDHGKIRAGTWLRYGNDGSISRGPLLLDPAPPLMAVPFVAIAEDTVVDLVHTDGRYDFVTQGATTLAHDRHGTLIIGDGALRVRTPVAGIQPIIVSPVDMSCTLEIEVDIPPGFKVDDEFICLNFLPCRNGEPIRSSPVHRWSVNGHMLQPALIDGGRRLTISYVQNALEGKSVSRIYINGRVLSEMRGKPTGAVPDADRQEPPDAYLIELPAQVAVDAAPEERDRAMRYRSLRLYPIAFEQRTIQQRSQRHSWEAPFRAEPLVDER